MSVQRKITDSSRKPLRKIKVTICNHDFSVLRLRLDVGQSSLRFGICRLQACRMTFQFPRKLIIVGLCSKTMIFRENETPMQIKCQVNQDSVLRPGVGTCGRVRFLSCDSSTGTANGGGLCELYDRTISLVIG